MNVWFQKVWNNGNKYFSVINYYDSWNNNGTGMIFNFRTNGANKKNPKDTCFDAHLTIGYIVINYTNFNFQNKRK